MLTHEDFTADPIEAEVHKAVAGYKIALILTGHKSFWHRLMCRAGGRKALSLQYQLECAERNAKVIVNKSPAHRAVLEAIVKRQTRPAARDDKLLSLVAE